MFGSAAVDRFETGEAALLTLRTERGELGAGAVACAAMRAALSVATGRHELCFCTLAPHTDYLRFATFGGDRTLRLVS